MVKVRLAEHDWLKGNDKVKRRFRTLQFFEQANGTVNVAVLGIKNGVQAAISIDRPALYEAFTALFPNIKTAERR